MSVWVSEWVYEWVYEWVCEWVGYECVYEWVCEWVSGYMRVCMSEWVCVCEWLISVYTHIIRLSADWASSALVADKVASFSFAHTSTEPMVGLTAHGTTDHFLLATTATSAAQYCQAQRQVFRWWTVNGIAVLKRWFSLWDKVTNVNVGLVWDVTVMVWWV